MVRQFAARRNAAAPATRIESRTRRRASAASTPGRQSDADRAFARRDGAHRGIRPHRRAAARFRGRARVRRPGREEGVHAAVATRRSAARRSRTSRVGYETYGKLNAAGDNAIFVPHFFTATSHAAGKYAPTDAAPGYWDPIIGAGRPIDTDKYFVISADALANLNTKDPNVTTTGPSTINPETGKPWGMAFPVVTYRDTVRVHKALRRHARREEAAGGRRRVGRLDPGDGVGRAVSRFRAARRARHRSRVRHLALRHRDDRRVDDADPPRSEMEQRRLLRPRRAARRRRERAQDHHHHDARARLGREDLRLQVGRRGQGSGRGDGQSVRDRGHADEDRASRARRRRMRTRCSTRRRRTSSIG